MQTEYSRIGGMLSLLEQKESSLSPLLKPNNAYLGLTLFAYS